MLTFDIETGPLSEAALRKKWSHPEFVGPGEFAPGSVKVGNIKDSVKQAEKIESARLAHEAAKSTARADYDREREAKWREYVSRAALSASTGRVLAIGYHSAQSGKTIVHGEQQTEAELLSGFWAQFLRMRKAGRKVVGFNSHSFDLPFLFRRSWMLGVDVPATARSGRYLDPLFVDLREVWLCGQRWNDCESSLNHVADCLGVGSKLDDVTGADFSRLWFGSPDERANAIEYLRQDVVLTYAVAVKLGVV